MKKIVIADFAEYNDWKIKLGNYHYCNCFVHDDFEALWVSNSFNELIYIKDKEDYKFKKSISTAERHEIAPNVYGFSAYSLRLYGNYLFSRNPKVVLNNEKYIFPNVDKTFEKIGFKQVDVLWISNPKLYWLTKVIDYQKLVYRIPDDFTHFKEYPGVEIIEEQLIKKADLIFVTASNLLDKAKQYNKEAYLLSNGVQFDHFHCSQHEMPSEFKGNQRKKVIYVGAIKYWFDLNLIQRLAREIDGDIYLIGKPEIDLSSLRELANIHILGARPYSDIPAYLAHSDVAIIPFIKSDLTDAVSPIKLYEYCSAGIAVVCSDMEEVRKLNAPIYVANDDDDFIRGVKQYFQDGYEQKDLVKFGEEHSWAARYQLVKKMLEL